MAHVEEHRTGTTRRDFLFVATGAAGGIATAAAVWPLINQMNPSADVQALASIQVDVSAVEVGSQLTDQVPRQAGLHPPPHARGDRRRPRRRRRRAARHAGAQRQPARRRARHRREPRDGRGRRVAGDDRRLHPPRLRADRRGRRLQRLVLPLPRLDLRHRRAHPQRPGAGEPAHPGREPSSPTPSSSSAEGATA